MPEPQPDQAQPAAESRPPEPANPPSAADLPTRAEATAARAEDGGEEPAEGPNGTTVQHPGGDGGSGTDGSTEKVPPRWSGSAPVPPPQPKRRWWAGRDEAAPAAAQPDPTRKLAEPGWPEPEEITPVDPWADTAGDPWADTPGHPLAAQPEHPAPAPLPPTRHFPSGGPARFLPPPAGPPPAGPVTPPHAVPAAPQSPAPPYPAAAPSSPAPPYPPATPIPPGVPPPRPPQVPPGVPPPRPPQAAPVRPLPPPPPPPGPVAKVPARTGPGHRTQGPPPGPPPGWRPPPGYGPAPAPARRRRRWPRRLLIMTLLSLVCCCGVPVYYAQPMWEQYPVHATLPAQLADLRLRDDPASAQTATRLEQDMRTAHLLSEDTFAGVYTDPNGKRVTIFGVTGFRLSPDNDVEAEITRLTEKYGLAGVETMETGVRGEHRRCGTGHEAGTDVVVCAWADHGSLGTAVFTRLSVPDSDALLTRMRTDIITSG